jgi:hypothetical protein
MTQMATDIEILELLDFDHSPVCEVSDETGEDSCNNPADWVVGVACCMFKMYVCDSDLNLCREFLAASEGRMFRCPQCKTPYEAHPDHIIVISEV